MRTPATVMVGFVVATGIFFAGYAANRPPAPVATSSSANQAPTYSCPMHPQYTSDRPGDCPICGMRLEPAAAVDAGKAGSTGRDNPGMIEVGAARQQLIGVRTDEVRRETSTHKLRVPGRIAVDDQRLYRIVSATDGWIVDLQPSTVGRFVKKDQPLASYYTKDLLPAERQFLLSIPANEAVPSQTKDFSQASIRTAGSANPQFPVDTLRSLGMSDLQIEEIHRTRTAAPHINVYSPVSGFVLTRNISPNQRFDKGTELYRIADLSRVWVLTDIFEKDRQFLKPGAQATVIYQGRRLQARMSDALPQFDSQSRTLKTRFELDNPGFVLQPDMFVDVELNVEMPPSITVPADAVFDSGLRRTVFVDHGQGNFEARRVEVGWRLGDRVEIVKGLMEGERVVAAANFLLDSESRMKAVSAGIFDAATDPVCGMEVDEKRAAAAGRKADHAGTSYFFCSDDCKRKFEEAPARYLDGGGSGSALMKAAAGHSHPSPASPAEARATESRPPTPSATSSGMSHMPASGDAAKAVHTATGKDPVCGMDVDVKEATAAGLVSTHAGKTVYFCAKDCKEKFDADPMKYPVK